MYDRVILSEEAVDQTQASLSPIPLHLRVDKQPRFVVVFCCFFYTKCLSFCSAYCSFETLLDSNVWYNLIVFFYKDSFRISAQINEQYAYFQHTFTLSENYILIKWNF